MKHIGYICDSMLNLIILLLVLKISVNLGIILESRVIYMWTFAFLLSMFSQFRVLED